MVLVTFKRVLRSVALSNNDRIIVCIVSKIKISTASSDLVRSKNEMIYQQNSEKSRGIIFLIFNIVHKLLIIPLAFERNR